MRPTIAAFSIALFAAAEHVAFPAAASSTTEPADSVSGDLNVFAAASLTDVFEAIETAFERSHPNVDVAFNFAASSELVGSIVDDGAPADLFASADQANMDKLVDAELNAGPPTTFATNTLAIVVETGNPLGITSVDDLADPDLIVVAAAPNVPIGAYTQEVFGSAGIEVTPDSLEENVRGILTKVTAGEADAGVVYVSDVFAAGDDAEGVEIPAGINVTAEYPIAGVSEGVNPDAAEAFIEFVLADEAQSILADFAFGPAAAATADDVSSTIGTTGPTLSTAA